MALPERETRLHEEELARWIAVSSGERLDACGRDALENVHCKGWKSAIAFVDRIAVTADELDHHPDVHVERYRNVRITTTTFATGKLSDADVALARRIDELADASGSAASR